MNIIKAIRAPFQDSWCKKCFRTMDETHNQLFAMAGVTVAHFRPHADPEYFLRTLKPIPSLSNLPAGLYACRGVRYHCPKCGRTLVRLSIFLPVRGKEKEEEDVYFDRGQVDRLFEYY